MISTKRSCIIVVLICLEPLQIVIYLEFLGHIWDGFRLIRDIFLKYFHVLLGDVQSFLRYNSEREGKIPKNGFTTLFFQNNLLKRKSSRAQSACDLLFPILIQIFKVLQKKICTCERQIVCWKWKIKRSKKKQPCLRPKRKKK